METIDLSRCINLAEGGLKMTAIDALSEKSTFENVTVTTGYGRISSAGMKLQKGVTGTIEISLKIETYSQKSYEEATKQFTNTQGGTFSKELQESINQKDYGSWWSRVFGRGSGKTSDHYLKVKEESVKFVDNTIKDILEKNFSGSSEEFKVTGKFEVTGTSSIPTIVELYIRTMQIKEGSRTVTVISNDVVAADDTGKKMPSEGYVEFTPSLV